VLVDCLLVCVISVLFGYFVSGYFAIVCAVLRYVGVFVDCCWWLLFGNLVVIALGLFWCLNAYYVFVLFIVVLFVWFTLGVGLEVVVLFIVAFWLFWLECVGLITVG